MAENVNNTIKTTVELDVNSAQQEIVKLNSAASDGTQDLEKRLDAKNKQIDIQNKLNQKAIADAQKLVNSLKGVVGKEKQYEKAVKTLNKAKLNEVKVNERNSKQQRKLAEGYKKSKGALNNLDTATGGFITKLKLLAANPIVLVITLLVGALMLLKEAFTSSEEGQNKFAKATAIVEVLIGNLMDLVADFAEMLVEAIQKPGEAWEGFIGILKKGFDIWKVQILDRMLGNLKILGGTFLSNILKMRIAWNEFTGDTKEADELTKTLEKVNKKIEEGYEAHRIANKQLVDGYNAATEAVKEFVKEQVKEAGEAAKVADMRAKADKIERGLIVRKSELESQIAINRLNARKEEEFSATQRKQFLLDAQKLEDELIDKETEYLELRRDAQILENTFSRSNKENLTKEAEAIAAVNNQITVRARRAKKLQNELNTISKEIVASENAATNEQIADLKKLDDFKKGLKGGEKDEEMAKIERDKAARLLELEDLKVSSEAKAQLKLDIDAKYDADKRALAAERKIIDDEQQLALDEFELERLRGLGEAKLADELTFLEKQRTQALSDKELTEKQIDLINKKYNKAGDKIRKLDVKQSKDADMAVLESALGAAAAIFGENKALSIATALISTYKGIAGIWGAPGVGTPSMIIASKVANSAIVAAQGFGTVKKIMATKAPGSSKSRGGGGGGGGGGSMAAPSIPTATTTDVSDLSASNAARSGVDTSIGNRATQTASANVQAGSNGNVIFSESSYNSFRSQVEFKEDKAGI